MGIEFDYVNAQGHHHRSIEEGEGNVDTPPELRSVRVAIDGIAASEGLSPQANDRVIIPRNGSLVSYAYDRFLALLGEGLGSTYFRKQDSVATPATVAVQRDPSIYQVLRPASVSPRTIVRQPHHPIHRLHRPVVAQGPQRITTHVSGEYGITRITSHHDGESGIRRVYSHQDGEGGIHRIASSGLSAGVIHYL